MNIKTTSLLVFILLNTATLTVSASPIDMPAYGFSIDTLDATPSTSAPTTALMQFLPISDAFAPNININIQPYPGTIKDYVSLSKNQFNKMNWVIIEEKQISDSEWTVEYKGSMKDQELHFYGRAVAKDSKVYLVTATAKESQWSTIGSTLRSHVDSFKTK